MFLTSKSFPIWTKKKIVTFHCINGFGAPDNELKYHFCGASKFKCIKINFIVKCYSMKRGKRNRNMEKRNSGWERKRRFWHPAYLVEILRSFSLFHKINHFMENFWFCYERIFFAMPCILRGFCNGPELVVTTQSSHRIYIFRFFEDGKSWTGNLHQSVYETKFQIIPNFNYKNK